MWDVLNALRAHDDRFNSMINSIDLDKNTRDKISIDVIGNRGPIDDADGNTTRADTGMQLPLFALGEWKDSILARIVKKVGDREYWDRWTADVVDIHATQVARINAILNQGNDALTAKFDAFHQGLKDNLNDSTQRSVRHVSTAVRGVPSYFTANCRLLCGIDIDIEHEVPLYCCAIGRPVAQPEDRMGMRALERGTH